MSITDQFKQGIKELKGRLIVPHQRNGVLWLLTRENLYNGGILCDEMGLGKTIQVITLILSHKVENTLILMPKSVVLQWKAEIQKFAPNLSVSIFDGKKYEPADVTLCSYSRVFTRTKTGNYLTPLHNIHWGRIVIDEAHEIRNPKSKLFGSVSRLSAKYKFALTGTPIFNKMSDFVTLCMFVGVSKLGVQQDFDGIKKKYVLRRTKDDIRAITKLPPCKVNQINIKMTEQERDLYTRVFEMAQNKIMTSSQKELNMEILEGILRCRQVMIHPQLYLDGICKKMDDDPVEWEGQSTKIQQMVDMIKGHPKEKSIVFCQFVQEMDIIQQALEGIQCFRIDGGVSSINRQKQIKQYRESKPGSVFLVQIKSGGVGLNLQEATQVYITTPSWNSATELQAIGRAHRNGQTQVVTVNRLVCIGDDHTYSIEESIAKLQDIKNEICAEVLDDYKKPIKENINVRDLKEIFAINTIKNV